MGLAYAILQAGVHPDYRKESDAFEEVEKGVTAKTPSKKKIKGGGPGSGRKSEGMTESTESLMEMGFMPEYPISKSPKAPSKLKKYAATSKIERRLTRLKKRRPDLVESGFFEAGGPGSGRKKTVDVSELEKTQDYLDKKLVNEIAKSYRTGRVIDPLTIMDNYPGQKRKWALLDGHHRLAALKRLGYTQIPVEIKDRAKYLRVEAGGPGSGRHKGFSKGFVNKIKTITSDVQAALPLEDCQIVSEALAQDLKTVLGGDVRVAYGSYDNTDHVWVEIPSKKMYIDPTFEQFSDNYNGMGWRDVRIGKFADSVFKQNYKAGDYKDIEAGGPGSGWTHEGGHVSHLMNENVTNEPVIPSPGKHAAAGIIVKDKKGNILIYSPKNNFGGYKNTFSKGTIEPGQTPQEAAIRELKEETGVEAKITGHLGSVERSTSTTRYYTGDQVGGTLTPSDESDNPRFVPMDDKLSDLLRNTSGKKTGDHEVLELLKNNLDLLHEKLSNAKGSNPGGMYKGSDGVTRYVKFYRDKGQGRAEAAANSIYNDLGISAPKSQIFGTGDYAHQIIKGGSTLESVGVTKENAREVLKGFAADVLVGNWDAVGLTYDNILMNEGKASRLDNGASFTYRAQGGSKPNALLNKTTEYEGFFNPAINREYAKLTKIAGYTSADEIPDIKSQVSKIVSLQHSSGGWANYLKSKAPYLSDHESTQFAAMLTARTEQLANRHPIQAAIAKLKIAIIEAGGPGSGWTTENGHVSHATGKTLELDTPHSAGMFTAELKSLGFIYHHAHQVTLEHKPVTRDYFVDLKKNMVVIVEKGNKWKIGSYLKVGGDLNHKVIITNKAEGQSKQNLLYELTNSFGYKPDEKTWKNDSKLFEEKYAELTKPVEDLKKAVDNAKQSWNPIGDAISDTKKTPSWNPNSMNQGDLVQMHNTSIAQGYEYQGSKPVGDGGMVKHIYTKPNPDAGGAFGKAIMEDTKTGYHTMLSLGKTQYDGSRPLQKSEFPAGDPENINKAKELGFTQGNNSADGDSTKWNHSNGMQVITYSPLYQGGGWKLINKDGNPFAEGQGPAKLGQSFTQLTNLQDESDKYTYGPHKAVLENNGFKYIGNSDTTGLWNKGSLSVKTHNDNSHQWAMFKDGKDMVVDGFGKSSLQVAISNYSLSNKEVEGPKFSPNSKAKQWLQDKADTLLQKGYIYKSSKSLHDGGYWHKYAQPGTDKNGETSIILQEKPGGTHEMFVSEKDHANGLQDEAKVDSVYPIGTTVTKSKEYNSQENMPKGIVTDKAYRQKVADTVKEVLASTVPQSEGYYNKYSGYTDDQQMAMRKQVADKIGLDPYAIAGVRNEISSWTGSSQQSMRTASQKVINGDKDANPAWIIEHEMTVQQLKPTMGDSIALYRGIGDDGYKAPAKMGQEKLANQIKAIKLLTNSAAHDYHVDLFSLGADSWTTDDSTGTGFQSGGILLHIPKVPIEYVMTSHKTNGAFGGGESEFVVAFPKAAIPISKANVLSANASSDAAVFGAIGLLRTYGWRVDVKGKHITLYEPQNAGKQIDLTAGGPGSGRHKEFPSVAPTAHRPSLSLKQQNAIDTYKPADKAIHKTAGIGEQLVRQAVGGVPTADNMPMDVLSRDGKYGLEVKTLTTQENNKITMHPASLRRKYAWAAKNKAKIGTVVLDMRHGVKSPSAVYFHGGVGSFRLHNMILLNGLSDLKKMMRKTI